MMMMMVYRYFGTFVFAWGLQCIFIIDDAAISSTQRYCYRMYALYLLTNALIVRISEQSHDEQEMEMFCDNNACMKMVIHKRQIQVSEMRACIFSAFSEGNSNTNHF